MEICAKTATHGQRNVRAWSNYSCERYSVIMEICPRGRGTGGDITGSGEWIGMRYDHSGVVRVRYEAGIVSVRGSLF